MQVLVGPQSVGYRLTQDALVFGGNIITASDVAVAKRLTTIGNPENITSDKLPKDLVNDAIDKIHTMLEDVIDRVKVSEPGFEHKNEICTYYNVFETCSTSYRNDNKLIFRSAKIQFQ